MNIQSNVIPIFNQDNHSVHHCVYCGGKHFTIGRHDAQCVKCDAAFPLANNNFEYKLGEA